MVSGCAVTGFKPRYAALSAVFLTACLIFCIPANAQDLDSLETAAASARAQQLLRTADSLRMNYDFRAAVGYYRQAIEAEPDTTRLPELEDMRLLGENGANMMDFVYVPNVVAKQKFSTKDFFLYYPMADKSWRAIPNVLDSLEGHPFAKAVYAPDGEDEIFFSAGDDDEVRNIYRTEYNDTIWSAPELLDENLVSANDEIYPVLSEDGQSLYFSSKGLFGMGGYDLYVSTWNKKTKSWDTPVNLGFPYSSPYDDMLFYDTPDGKYTIFASNRDCPPDSICVYVLEHDSLPIHKKVESAEELREIMRLEPVSTETASADGSKAAVPESEDTKLYMEKIAEVRALRDSIYTCSVAVDEARGKYAMTDDDQERGRLAEQITEYELLLPRLQSDLEKASAELQSIEMDFLHKGVIIDPDKMGGGEQKAEAKDIGYDFVKLAMGSALDINVEVVDKFDYSFMILPEGRFAADNNLPSGLVYQIQIFSINRKATVKDLNGLSPVFSRAGGSGYIYSVGLFRSYSDVLSQLNKVRRAGFKTAFIIAFLDGKSISVTTARGMEKY